MHCEKIKMKYVIDNIFSSNDVQRTSFNEKPLKPSLFILLIMKPICDIPFTLHDFGDHFFYHCIQIVVCITVLSLYSNICAYHSLSLYFNICTYHNLSLFILIFVHITVISIVFQYLSIWTYHKLSLYFNIVHITVYS